MATTNVDEKKEVWTRARTAWRTANAKCQDARERFASGTVSHEELDEMETITNDLHDALEMAFVGVMTAMNDERGGLSAVERKAIIAIEREAKN